MAREHSMYFERVTDDNAVDVEVFYTITDYDPGVSWGPAESCYPPEGGEVEILRAKIGDTEVEYTDDEAEEWAGKILDNHDFDDYYDGFDG